MAPDESPTRSLIEVSDCSQVEAWGGEAGWDINYQQLGRGQYGARLSAAEFGSVIVTSEFHNREIATWGSPAAGTVCLFMSVSNAPVLFRGVELSDSEAGIFGAGDDLVVRATSGAQVLAVSASWHDVCGAIVSRWGYDPEDVLPTGGVIGLAPVHRRALLDGMRGALDVAAGGTKTSSEMEQELVASLVDALVSASGLLPQPGRRYRGVEYVKRSQDYVEAHLDADIRAADLAEAAESSVRTVQSSFKKLLGVSPMQYVRIRRLGRLRRSLLSRGKGQTVTRLALEHGINHMGRLSVEYHGLFGECPRETGR